MKGSLQIKNGKYYAVLSYKNEQGKDTRKWIATGLTEKGNKRKAEAMLNDILQEYNNKELFIESKPKRTNDILLSDYLTQWLTTRRNEVEEITYESYSININILAEYFKKKNIYLQELKPYDIQEFYNQLYDKGCNGNTAIHYHVLLREALQSAVKLGLVEKNIADFVNRPKKEKYQAEFYNKEELKQLFEAIKCDPLELVIHITAYYGLRRSEVLGLKWSAIDFTNKMIKINHKVVRVKKKGLVKKNKMKNKTSNRTLPLIPHIEQMLLAEKKKQEENKKLCGNSYNKEFLDYVCVNQLGELFKPDYLTQHFRIIQDNNNLKHIRFHDLRHSCASLMLANGTPMKQIQEWLGHSTFQTTADIYAHLDYSSKISSANTISNALTFDEPIKTDIEIDISDYEQNNKQERNFDQKTKEELQKEIQRLEQMIRDQEEQERLEKEREERRKQKRREQAEM